MVLRHVSQMHVPTGRHRHIQVHTPLEHAPRLLRDIPDELIFGAQQRRQGVDVAGMTDYGMGNTGEKPPFVRVQYGHYNVATCAIWPLVQYGHLCNMDNAGEKSPFVRWCCLAILAMLPLCAIWPLLL